MTARALNCSVHGSGQVTVMGCHSLQADIQVEMFHLWSDILWFYGKFTIFLFEALLQLLTHTKWSHRGVCDGVRGVIIAVHDLNTDSLH